MYKNLLERAQKEDPKAGYKDMIQYRWRKGVKTQNEGMKGANSTVQRLGMMAGCEEAQKQDVMSMKDVRGVKDTRVQRLSLDLDI